MPRTTDRTPPKPARNEFRPCGRSAACSGETPEPDCSPAPVTLTDIARGTLSEAVTCHAILDRIVSAVSGDVSVSPRDAGDQSEPSPPPLRAAAVHGEGLVTGLRERLSALAQDLGC